MSLAEFIPLGTVVLAWTYRVSHSPGLLLLFSYHFHWGICSHLWLGASRSPGGRQGRTVNSCAVLGKAVCISELCVPNSKVEITKSVPLTQFGGARETMCGEGH